MFKILFARFPYGASEHPHVANWMISTIVKCKADKRIGEIYHREYDDTPIHMTRNKCLLEAEALGCDYCVMIDSDMSPDLPLPGAVPFWDSSWEFLMKTRDRHSSVIAAPYCGPPPHENIYVFRPGSPAAGDPEKAWSVDQFAREEAAIRTGIEEVMALPTGLIIIDVRALEKLPHPWFDYEWTDKTMSQKSSTEDVFFTRNLSLLGVPQFVNWDAWAGHVKRKIVAKPWVLTTSDVRHEFAESIRKDLKDDERVIEVGKTDMRTIRSISVPADKADVTPRRGQLLQDPNREPLSTATVADLLPTSLREFSGWWHDDPEFHLHTHESFSRSLHSYPKLADLRSWVEERNWGFGERSAYYLWRLIVKDAPECFNFLEVGVHRGQTCILIAMLADELEKSSLVVALSTFDGEEVKDFDKNKGNHLEDFDFAWSRWVPKGHPDSRNTIIGNSKSTGSIREAAAVGPYHVVFIDGGHDLETASSDIANYSPMVKTGGILVVDDCANDLKLPKTMFPGFPTVTQAARKILPLYRDPPSEKWHHLGNVNHMRIWRRK